MHWLTRLNITYKLVVNTLNREEGGKTMNEMVEKTIIDIETEIVSILKNIYDPEIPVNIYDLGLIYEIEVDDEHAVEITMTLTAPNCPVADHLLEDIERQVKDVEGVSKALDPSYF